MEAKSLTNEHIGSVYRIYGVRCIILQDFIIGERAVLLQTDKGTLLVDPSDELEAGGLMLRVLGTVLLVGATLAGVEETEEVWGERCGGGSVETDRGFDIQPYVEWYHFDSYEKWDDGDWQCTKTLEIYERRVIA